MKSSRPLRGSAAARAILRAFAVSSAPSSVRMAANSSRLDEK
jgi:hypothetical protein